MTSPTDIQNALANEARRSELRQKVASLRGGVDATASLLQRISSLNTDQQQQLQEALNTLASFEAGAGPGVTDNFGPKSSVTLMIEAERNAGMAAVIAYIKANPTCTVDDAAAQWSSAAIASHPAFPTLIQDGHVMASLYQTNLVTSGTIAENSWGAFRDWVAATPTDTITAM